MPGSEQSSFVNSFVDFKMRQYHDWCLKNLLTGTGDSDDRQDIPNIDDEMFRRLTEDDGDLDQAGT